MSRDVDKAISNAIEASYLVDPEVPGLLRDELHAVLAPLGYEPGEINDALKRSNKVGSSRNGYVFTDEGLPIYLTEHWLPYEEDPRDWDVFTFVHAKLQGLARAKGLAKATLSISALYLEAAAQGIDRHQVALAVYGLPLMHLAKLDEAANTITLTDQGQRWGQLNGKRDSDIGTRSRPDFDKLLDAVRVARGRRQPAVRWQELRSALEALGPGENLNADEQRVLNDVCARFADNGDPIAIGEVLRRLPDLEVQHVAMGLVDKQQLQVRPDERVVPSLLALHRHLELFPELFVLTDDVLRRAKEMWESHETVVLLAGPHGLIARAGHALGPVVAPRITLAVKQFGVLLDALSLRPSLVPAASGRVNVGDEARNTASLGALIAYQRQHNVRQPPKVVALEPQSQNMPTPTKSYDHIGPKGSPPAVTRTRPTMFIGSTVEALKVARAVHAELDHDLEITLWNQNVFEPGNATWLDLVTQARTGKYDFALVVLGAEDAITSRGTTGNGPRDNCLLELGLFEGAIGPDRTFFLIDRDNKPKIATDLLGITPLVYGGNRTDRNYQSAVGPACEQIRQRVEKLKQTK